MSGDQDYKPGPSIDQFTTREHRSNGSVPPWHFYDAHELPHHRPDEPVVFITRYDRKGNTTDVRLLKDGSSFRRDGGA